MNTNDTELLIFIINRLFDTTKKRKIKELSELSQERLLKEILVEIEPKLEKIGGKIEINEDSNFGIRYANIVSILNCIEKYLAKSPEKEKFSNNTDFKNSLIINDLLKNDKEQLFLVSQILLFITSISSRKDYYLDLIGEFEDIKYVNAFFTHIEKYIMLEGKTDETNLNQSHFDKSYMLNNQFNKMKDEYEREKENFLRTMKENEKEIHKLKEKTEFLERNFYDLELKYKDKERECEIAKSSHNQNLKAQEEMFQDNITITELVSQLNQKDSEIADLKQESEMNSRRLNDELKRIREKIETYEDKMQDYKFLKSQNEKLNSKIKELSITKDQKIEIEEMKKNLEIKNKQIETLLKEKQSFATQIEKLNKDLLAEKEKFRQAEFERKKLEIDMNEIKKECSRLETKNIYYNAPMNINNISEVRRGPPNMNNSEIGGEDIKLFDLGGDSIIFDDFKDFKGKNPGLEKEYMEIKNEKNELAKLYKAQIDEIHKLIDEKDRLLNTIDTYKLEIDKHNSEKERLGIEKEKLEILVQKSDLDCQKLRIHIERFENEKRRMEEDIKELNEKIEILTADRNLKIKENDQLRESVNSNKLASNKILAEKQTLINEYQNLFAEYEKLKNTPSETTNVKNNKNTKIQPASKSNYNPQLSEALNEVTLLKSEIQNLKSNIWQKDELIKNLKEKIKNLEEIVDASDKISQELNKKQEDLEFYRRSYDEQKNRVNREHELISASLYELALQFMSLKTDLQKKMNPNNESTVPSNNLK